MTKSSWKVRIKEILKYDRREQGELSRLQNGVRRGMEGGHAGDQNTEQTLTERHLRMDSNQLWTPRLGSKERETEAGCIQRGSRVGWYGCQLCALRNAADCGWAFRGYGHFTVLSQGCLGGWERLHRIPRLLFPHTCLGSWSLPDVTTGGKCLVQKQSRKNSWSNP